MMRSQVISLILSKIFKTYILRLKQFLSVAIERMLFKLDMVSMQDMATWQLRTTTPSYRDAVLPLCHILELP